MRRPPPLVFLCALFAQGSAAQEPVLAMTTEGGRAASIDELDIPWQHQDEERLEVERGVAWEQILRYGHQAREVLIGKVLSASLQDSGSERVVLDVQRSLRGRPGPVVEFIVPHTDGIDDGIDDVELVKARVVEGYRVLVYLDAARYLVEGNALFVVEGGYVWRNKRQSVFLRPRSDRVWIDQIDPSPNYVVFSLDEIEQAMQTTVGRHRKRGR